MRDNIRSHACPERGPEDAGAGEDEYWRRMGLVMDQFDGLCEGVWSAALPGRNISYWELYVLQSVGDLYDLTVLYPQRGGIGGLEAEEPSQREYRPGHGSVGPGGYGAGELLECSAIIKLDGAILTEPLEVERRRLNAKGGWRGETGRGFWAGHTTWRPFYAMLRTWKIYDLPWSRSGRISVSSSPGFVGYSKDDW